MRLNFAKVSNLCKKINLNSSRKKSYFFSRHLRSFFNFFFFFSNFPEKSLDANLNLQENAILGEGAFFRGVKDCPRHVIWLFCIVAQSVCQL